MSKKDKTSHRSNTASVRRAISDLKKARDRINISLITLKSTKKKSDQDKMVIADTTEALNSFNLLLVALDSTLKRFGMVDYKTKEPLTPAEEQEIIALRTGGLRGKPLYSKKELACQYGISIDKISELDFHAPL